MWKTPERPCPICNGLKVEALHAQRFELIEGHPLSTGYTVVCCERCGFVYADTAATQADYDRFYADHSKYSDLKTGTGGGYTPYDFLRLQNTARQVADFLRSPHTRILDVGCANGGLLKALQDLGYVHLLGVDPSPVCVENTRHLGLDACIGSLSQPFERGPFDCVILSHTLEHVYQVGQAVAWLAQLLEDDPPGCVYIEVPDAARYADHIAAPFQDFNTEHINHFSLVCLSNLMHLAGFKCLQSGDKLIDIGSGLQYPAVYGFWRRLTDPPVTPHIQNDKFLRQRALDYIAASHKLKDKIDFRLREAISRSPQLIVWGAGQLAMKLLIDSPLAQAEIVAFVDSNPVNQGQRLHGIPIIAPQDIPPRTQPIVIATTIHHHAIAASVNQLGLPNELILLSD